MPSDIDYIAESKRLIPAMAWCYDCDWYTKDSPCRGEMEKHRQENPTHWVGQASTESGLIVAGAHEQLRTTLE